MACGASSGSFIMHTSPGTFAARRSSLQIRMARQSEFTSWMGRILTP